VVLADDSVLLREGIARLLVEAGFDVVAQSGNAEDLLRHVAMHKPDVAVVDIRMPPTQTDEGCGRPRRSGEPRGDRRARPPSTWSRYAMDLLREAEGVGYLPATGSPTSRSSRRGAAGRRGRLGLIRLSSASSSAGTAATTRSAASPASGKS
jgi:CheY-like chemotaxis protein